MALLALWLAKIFSWLHDFFSRATNRQHPMRPKLCFPISVSKAQTLLAGLSPYQVVSDENFNKGFAIAQQDCHFPNRE